MPITCSTCFSPHTETDLGHGRIERRTVEVAAGADVAGLDFPYLRQAFLITRDVRNLNVDPDRWGRGVGRALLAAGCGHPRAVGFATAVLWVHPENARASLLPLVGLAC